MKPLLSVIIPTFRRPGQLRRAIVSALGAAPNDEVEVVVVPNGPDNSWKSVAQEFRHDSRIHWHALILSNACAARNYGLTKACGKYVRFLDDDDYLYPAAASQILHVESNCLDICSAPLENISTNGDKVGTFYLPDSNDHVIASLLSVGISLTQGSIFLRSSIQNLWWREDVVLYDDYLWMLSLANKGELTWAQTADPVGAYVQHDNARLSRTRRSGKNSRPLVEAIFSLHEKLTATGRSSPGRAQAAAVALLTHVHSAFPSSPVYLSRAIKHAKEIAPTAHPMQLLFRAHPWLAHNLLATEWAIIVPRYCTRGCRRASWWLHEKLT